MIAVPACCSAEALAAQMRRLDADSVVSFGGSSASDTAKVAVAAVRQNSRPHFYRIDTFRLMAHSKADDNRPADYVQAHWARDPLAVIERQLADDSRWQLMIAEVDAEIEEATAAATAAAFGRIDPPPVG